MLAYYRVAFYNASHSILDLICKDQDCRSKGLLLLWVQFSQSQQTDSMSSGIPVSVMRRLFERIPSRLSQMSVMKLSRWMQKKVIIRETTRTCTLNSSCCLF
jgi:hypothetical protein